MLQLQDLLTYSLRGLACWAHWAAQQGVDVPRSVYSFLHAGTFATLTNGEASPCCAAVSVYCCLLHLLLLSEQPCACLYALSYAHLPL